MVVGGKYKQLSYMGTIMKLNNECPLEKKKDQVKYQRRH